MNPQQQTTYSTLIGWVLAQERGRARLTQAQLAQKMGLPQSSWSRFESGQGVLSIDQLDQAARHLGSTGKAVLEKAEHLRTALANQGVRVEPGSRQPGSDTEKFLWGAALGALVAALLLSR